MIKREMERREGKSNERNTDEEVNETFLYNSEANFISLQRRKHYLNFFSLYITLYSMDESLNIVNVRGSDIPSFNFIDNVGLRV